MSHRKSLFFQHPYLFLTIFPFIFALLLGCSNSHFIQMRSNILFQFKSTFVVNSLKLIIFLTILENKFNKGTKLLSISTLPTTQFFVNCFYIDWFFYDNVIVRNILKRDRLTKRPRRLMFVEHINNIFALEKKRNFLRPHKFIMLTPSPSTLLYAINQHRI